MPARSIARTVAYLGLAAAGLVASHGVSYAVAVRDVHHRAVLLSQTGHGYLSSASWAAIVMGLAALVAGVACGYARRPSRSAERGWTAVAARLVPLQILSFLLLEVLERVLSSSALTTLSPSLILVGVITQILAASLVALLVAGLRGVGIVLASAGRPPAGRTLIGSVALRSDRLFGGRPAVTERERAPPSARAA